MPILQNPDFEYNLSKETITLFKNLTCHNRPPIQVGDKVKVVVYLELSKENTDVKSKEKERLQIFEGIVISKHLSVSEIDATITVRKMFQMGGVEKVFLLNSPWIKRIDVVGRSLVRKSKLYYLRELTGKSARLKRRLDFSSVVASK